MSESFLSMLKTTSSIEEIKTNKLTTSDSESKSETSV